MTLGTWWSRRESRRSRHSRVTERRDGYLQGYSPLQDVVRRTSGPRGLLSYVGPTRRQRRHHLPLSRGISLDHHPVNPGLPSFRDPLPRSVRSRALGTRNDLVRWGVTDERTYRRGEDPTRWPETRLLRRRGVSTKVTRGEGDPTSVRRKSTKSVWSTVNRGPGDPTPSLRPRAQGTRGVDSRSIE